MRIAWTGRMALILRLGLGALSVSIPAGADLPQRYQKWLDEEVVYIITRTEKDVFLKLRSDRERDLFIEAFWRHRDPTPASPENEFKTEHYRRIATASRLYGRQVPRPGWKTDRGRIYIILGEPNDIQRFEGKTQTYPAEVWFYQDKSGLGLPPGFHIVFFQEGGIGDFRLYSPARDGPQALLTQQRFDPTDFQTAYNMLSEIEPGLAEVSLSLVPGEETAGFGRPSLASDLLLRRVETAPERQVEEKYAQKFLEYKDIVEVEYTANYMDSEALVKVIKDPSGPYFVHFAIEPARLSVGQSDKNYYAHLKLNGRVTTTDGRPVHQFERTIRIDLDEKKLADAGRQPLNIHDMFPLVSGSYRLSLLLKNEVSKEFTSLDQAIVIPPEAGRIQMTPLVLGYATSPPEGNPAALKPFRFGGFQVHCQPNRVFLPQDRLGLAFQVHGLPAAAREQAELKFIFLKNDQEFRSFSKRAGQYGSFPDVLQEIGLGDFTPAHYRLQVSLVVDGAEVVRTDDEFDVTPLTSVRRPWIYSNILPAASDPIYDYLLGTQLYNIGQVDDAMARLERAWRRRPDSTDYALNLAQAYLTKGAPEKIVPLLESFFKPDKPLRYEIYWLQGKAYQELGDWDRAIAMFDAAILNHGLNTMALNAVGECYFLKGDWKAALTAWDKSLELNPDQPVIRKRVETLRSKVEE